MQGSGCSEQSLLRPLRLHLHWLLAHLGRMGNGSPAFLPSGRRKKLIRAANSSENSPYGSVSLQIPYLLRGVQAFIPALPSWQVRLAWVNTQWCWINTWQGLRSPRSASSRICYWKNKLPFWNSVRFTKMSQRYIMGAHPLSTAHIVS